MKRLGDLDKGLALTISRKSLGHVDTHSEDCKEIFMNPTFQLKDKITQSEGFFFFHTQHEGKDYLVMTKIYKYKNNNRPMFSIATAYLEAESGKSLSEQVGLLLHMIFTYQTDGKLDSYYNTPLHEQIQPIEKRKLINSKAEILDFNNYRAIIDLFLNKQTVNEKLKISDLPAILKFYTTDTFSDLIISNLSNEYFLEYKKSFSKFNLDKKLSYNKINDNFLREAEAKISEMILKFNPNEIYERMSDFFIKNAELISDKSEHTKKLTHEDIKKLFIENDKSAYHFITRFQKYFEPFFRLENLLKVIEDMYARSWENKKVLVYMEEKIKEDISNINNLSYQGDDISYRYIASDIVKINSQLLDKISKSQLSDVFIHVLFKNIERHLPNKNSQQCSDLCKLAVKLNDFFPRTNKDLNSIFLLFFKDYIKTKSKD